MTPRPPRILIHMEDPRRDGSVLMALAHLFAEAGARPFLSTRRTTEPLLRALPFEAVLVSTPENISFDALPRIRRRTRIFMLPTEGAIFEEGPLMIKYGGGEDRSRWDRHIESIRHYFLWGQNSRRVLLATGRFRQEQLVVTGAPRMDFFLAQPAPPAQAQPQEGWLGIVSSFILINSIVPVPLFQNIDQNRKINWASQARTRYYEDRLWTEAACLRVLLEFIEECHRRRQKLWIRMHFQEAADNWRALQKSFPGTLHFEAEDRPFESWLDRVRAMAAFNSTTFFEAVAAGKPALNLTPLVGPRLAEHTDRFPQTHYPILDQVESAEGWEGAFRFLDRIRRMKPGQPYEHSAQARAILQEVCGFPRPISALARVVHTVLADLGEPSRAEATDRLKEGLALARAKALEVYTFHLRRDPVGNCWFPLRPRQLRRRFANEIQRYLRAAHTFPWVEEPARRLAEPSALAAEQVG